MTALWKPYYLPGDRVWIISGDGRFFEGMVEKESSSHQYKPLKKKGGGKPGGNHKIGSPMKKYLVHCREARELQPSSKGYQVLCAPTQLYPREKGDRPPHLQTRDNMLKEMLDEKLRQRAGIGSAPPTEGDGGSAESDLA
jgi:hypothetical protein